MTLYEGWLMFYMVILAYKCILRWENIPRWLKKIKIKNQNNTNKLDVWNEYDKRPFQWYANG